MANQELYMSFEKVESIIAWVHVEGGDVPESMFMDECYKALSLALVGHRFTSGGPGAKSLKGLLALDMACALFATNAPHAPTSSARTDVHSQVIQMAWDYPYLPGAQEILAQSAEFGED